MIYKILQIAWWAICLSCGLFFGTWDADDQSWKERIFFFIFYLACSALIAALVQGFFTWLGNLFAWFGNLLAHL